MARTSSFDIMEDELEIVLTCLSKLIYDVKDNIPIIANGRRLTKKDVELLNSAYTKLYETYNDLMKK